MALDRTRTLRGALAGAAAAAVWAAQQPLDQRVFGVDYDDVELLGRFVTRGPRRATRSGSRCTSPTARCSARSTPTRAARCRCPAALRGPAGRARRAPRDLAGHRRAVARPPRRRRPARAVGLRPRVRAGDLAPPAVRRGARRARAAAEPARLRAEPDRPRRRRLQRPRLGRVRRVAQLTVDALSGASSITGAYRLRRRATSSRACEAAGDDVVTSRRAVVGVDLRDPAAARALVARRAPDVVYHLAARAHVGAVVGGPDGDAARQRRDDAQRCSRRSAPRRPRRSSSRSARARCTGRRRRVPTDRVAAAAPAEPVRGLEGLAPTCSPRFYADAHGLRVIHARAFNHAGPGQEPIYAIATFARQFAEGLEAGDDPVRDRHRQPRHAPRLHRRPRRRPRLPAARRARRAGRLQRLLRRHPLGAASCRRARPRSPASPSTTRSTRRCVRAHEVHGDPRRQRPPARRHRLGARDPARADPRATPSPGGAQRKGTAPLDARRANRL